MQKNKIKYLMMVGILAICSLTGPLVGHVWADSNSMTVSPPNQKIILTPGEVYTGSLNVSNSSNSTRDLKYAVEVGSYSRTKGDDQNVKDDYGAMDFVSESSYNQIMGWIKLDKENGTVAPGEAENIGYQAADRQPVNCRRRKGAKHTQCLGNSALDHSVGKG